jgi:hypothetical protein
MVTSARTKFKAVTKGNPCLVCGGNHKCAVGDDGLLSCGRKSGEQPGFVHLGAAKKDPQFHLYRREGDPILEERERAYQQANEQRNGHTDWSALAGQYQAALTSQLRDELAADLGVPAANLALLGVGWREEEKCWTFPEHDAAGKVIGILRRPRDGKKMLMAGGKRGLIIPSDWQQIDGPILLPEGPTDVLACRAMGLCAIGRPSNMAGVELLARLLRDVVSKRECIVIGDNDPKPTTGLWPGRDGAKATAEALSQQLGRLVPWCLPPDGAKDVREWLKALHLGTDCQDALEDAGMRLQGHLNTYKQGKYDPQEGDGEMLNSSFSPIGEKKNYESVEFPPPIAWPDLKAIDREHRWLWERCIERGSITLLSAYWKAGKTTLLKYLLAAMASGGDLCGLTATQGKVLYVTEEPEARWAERRREMGLAGEHVRFLINPFIQKPQFPDWLRFIKYLKQLQEANPADLIVLDTLTNIWPVKDENDASEVQRALMPLRPLLGPTSLLASAHLRKSDGAEGTATRGSGALLAFVNCIIEVRRYDEKSDTDRRRVLKWYAHWEGLPERVIELSADGLNYTAAGERHEVVRQDLRDGIRKVLPGKSPGLEAKEVHAAWKTNPRPGEMAIRAELSRGAEADPPEWQREGEGKKGSPYTYWLPRLPEESREDETDLDLRNVFPNA